MIQVSNLSRKRRGAWEIRRREKILFPPERVWIALTEPGELTAWWCDEAELDLRPGGIYSFSGKTVYPTRETEGNFEILGIEDLSRLEYRWFIDEVETTVLY